MHVSTEGSWLRRYQLRTPRLLPNIEVRDADLLFASPDHQQAGILDAGWLQCAGVDNQ
jgi:hypothetical protein